MITGRRSRAGAMSAVGVLSLAAVALQGCASGPAPSGPIVSPTGIVYDEGTPPVETRLSQTATLFLRRDVSERALEMALQGVDEDPGNPVHYFLAGVAYARLGLYRDADRMYSEAQRIFPAYELAVEPEREAAWGAAFNAGLASYEEGDVESALAAWRRAALIFDLRPEAHRNLAALLTAEQELDEAIAVYRAGLEGLEKRPATREMDAVELQYREGVRDDLQESLTRLLLATGRFADAEPVIRQRLSLDPTSVPLRVDLAASLAGQGRPEDASEIHRVLLFEEGLSATELFTLGIALFRSSDYVPAAAAFGRLTDVQPESRDAWFNYVNALFAGEDWSGLVEAGARLLELDPLGESARLVSARAHLETGDAAGAMRQIEAADAAPVHVDELQLQRGRSRSSVSGRITGNAAEPGTSIRLRFVFYDEAGTEVGTSDTPALRAPAPGLTDRFEVSFPMSASAYRYEVLP